MPAAGLIDSRGLVGRPKKGSGPLFTLYLNFLSVGELSGVKGGPRSLTVDE